MSTYEAWSIINKMSPAFQQIGCGLERIEGKNSHTWDCNIDQRSCARKGTSKDSDELISLLTILVLPYFELFPWAFGELEKIAEEWNALGAGR